MTAKVVSILVDGRRRVSSTLPDGTEMVEEFDAKSHELLLRKSRKPTVLGGEGEWKIEVGHQGKPFDPSKDAIAPSSSAPVFCRLDSKECFQWRIRNLPYAAEVFSVTVEGQEIIVRTSNKKYFKRIEVPDMQRLKLTLEPSALNHKFQYNTLVISYKKPKEALDYEIEHLQEALKSSLTI
jgi:hypothetical protein